MESWVLIFWMWTTGGPAAATAEFTSKAKCEAAAAELIRRRTIRNVQAFCAEK